MCLYNRIALTSKIVSLVTREVFNAAESSLKKSLVWLSLSGKSTRSLPVRNSGLSRQSFWCVNFSFQQNGCLETDVKRKTNTRRDSSSLNWLTPVFLIRFYRIARRGEPDGSWKTWIHCCALKMEVLWQEMGGAGVPRACFLLQGLTLPRLNTCTDQLRQSVSFHSLGFRGSVSRRKKREVQDEWTTSNGRGANEVFNNRTKRGCWTVEPICRYNFKMFITLIGL